MAEQVFPFTHLPSYSITNLLIGSGRRDTPPVNRSSLEVKGEENWHDIKVQSAAFAAAKA
jgi:hypothetical protein